MMLPDFQDFINVIPGGQAQTLWEKSGHQMEKVGHWMDGEGGAA